MLGVGWGRSIPTDGCGAWGSLVGVSVELAVSCCALYEKLPGANAATLAGEGDESIVFALGTVEAREAPLELTAAQVALEGVVHEARKQSSLFGESIVKTREVLGYWSDVSSGRLCLY